MHAAGKERRKAGQNSGILLYIWKLVLKTWGEILAQMKLMAKLQWGRISPLGTKQKYLHPYKLRMEICFQQDIICYYLFHSSSKKSFVICSVSCLKEIRIKIVVDSISPTYEYRDQLINVHRKIITKPYTYIAETFLLLI